MTRPVLKTTYGQPTAISIVPTADGQYDIVATHEQDKLVKLCTCETYWMAAQVQRALFLYYEHHTPAAIEARRVKDQSQPLSDLGPGGLPNWQAQPFLPGQCIRCGLQVDVTGYVYKNASGGYSLVGALCWPCCDQVTEQLQAGGASL
jgi:hypothetical protein